MEEIKNPIQEISETQEDKDKEIAIEEEVNSEEIKDKDKPIELVEDENFEVRNGRRYFKKGNRMHLKSRRRIFSLRNDLIKSLKRIKSKDKVKYQKIIDSYWEDPKMRSFLMEQIDGKARQSIEMGGSLENPIRIIEIKPMEEPKEEENREEMA